MASMVHNPTWTAPSTNKRKPEILFSLTQASKAETPQHTYSQPRAPHRVRVQHPETARGECYRLAWILVYNSLPQIVEPPTPPLPPFPPAPSNHTASRMRFRPRLESRSQSSLVGFGHSPVPTYDCCDGVQVLARAAACSQRFDGISLVGICAFAILFARTVRGRTLKTSVRE